MTPCTAFPHSPARRGRRDRATWLHRSCLPAALALLAVGDSVHAGCDLDTIIPSSLPETVLEITTTLDENDGGSGGSGLALRDAILIANANPGRHYRLQLQTGERYALTLSGVEVLGNLGDLNLRTDATVTIETIDGDEPAIIDAGDLASPDRVLTLLFGARAVLRDVEVRGGYRADFQGDGGGLYVGNGCHLGLESALIRDNSAQNGGGVLLNVGDEDTTLVIVGSTLSGNRARYGEGGGVKAVEGGIGHGRVCIEDSLFTDNRSSSAGGALAALSGAAVAIERGRFVGNRVASDLSAGPGGGAIYALGKQADLAALDIAESRFEGNLGADVDIGGGAVYAELAEVTITDSQFLENRLTGSQQATGGAIHVRQDGSLDLSGSRFIGNRNEVTSAAEGAGGGIAGNGTSVVLRDSHFEQNHATGYGGAVRLIDGDNRLEGLVFTNNSAGRAGGALSLVGNDSGAEPTLNRITDTRFEANTSGGDGGAIRLLDGITRWTDIRLIGNRADGTVGGRFSGDGGAIVVAGGDHGFVQMRAVGNHAAQDGGVISIDATGAATQVAIRNAQIENNRAEDDGGAIDIFSTTFNFGRLTLRDIDARRNSAGDSGGFLRLLDGISGTLSHSRLIGNHCGDRANPEQEIFGSGGALQISASSLTASDVVLRENSARFGGGAVQASLGQQLDASVPGRLRLINAALIGNRTPLSEGGAVLADNGADVELVNTLVLENSAAVDGAALYAAPQRGFDPQAIVKLINVTAFGNIADSNGDGNGAGGLFSGPPVPTSDDGVVFEDNAPATVEVYNSLFAGTLTGSGAPALDYAGAAPTVTRHSAPGSIDDIGGWEDPSNLLAVDLGLASVCAGIPTPGPGSPLINAGDNARLPTDSADLDNDDDTTETLPLDLLGQTRIEGDLVDIGAVEASGSSIFDAADSDCDRLADAWERHWFGHLDRNGRGDIDADGQTELAELLAGSDPTYAGSGVRMAIQSGLGLAAFPSPPPEALDSCFALLNHPDAHFTDALWRADPDGRLLRCDVFTADDFSLDAGLGWYVRFLRERELVVDPAQGCSPQMLHAGLNLLGHPLPQPGLTCRGWLAANGPQRISAIAGLDPDTGRWHSCAWSHGDDGEQPAGVDFLILPGVGYRIFATDAGVLMRPGCG